MVADRHAKAVAGIGWVEMGRSSARVLRHIGTLAAVLLGTGALVGTPYAYAAPAATFTVNTTDDVSDGACNSTHCSLREAVDAANATPAADAIHFAIPGAGPHLIRPSSMVFVFNPVTIDGTTEPDYAGSPVVQIDGASAPTGDGVQFQGSGSLLRGVSVTGWNGIGVWLRDAGNAVEASWIGVTPAGAPVGNAYGVVASGTGSRVGGPNAGDGNVVADSVGTGITVGHQALVQGNIVGLGPDGEQPAAAPNPYSNLNGIELNSSSTALTGSTVRGNVVSGNRQEGIQLSGAGVSANLIEDNLVGTDEDAEVKIGNGASFRGISLAFGAHHNTIDGNVVAGSSIGIQLIADGTVQNVLTGNYIGTNAAGASLPNVQGIVAYVGPNTIGGTTVGSGNVVHHNTGSGIEVAKPGGSAAPTGVRILGNSVDQNGGAGINLANISANDAGDVDGFENDGQNFPILSGATGTLSATTVSGTLDTNASEAFRIELFASPACDGSGRGEGATFLGFVDVATDGSGHASFNETFGVGIGDGDVVTATATDAVGNTSELSPCSTADVDTTNTLRVSSNDDTNDGSCTVAHCSLREAILGANASPDRNAITFGVTGTIAPTSALPTISAPVDIDGGSQPACAGTPAVVLDGVSAGSNVSGLVLGAGSGGSTVRGLVVQRFSTGSGIRLASNDNVVQCSYVGTNAAGTSAAANEFGVEVLNGNGNLIGGTAPGQGNLLSGNSFQGARISGLTATGNKVKGNLIGTDVTGKLAIPNSAFGGVNLGGTGNEVGGSEPGARNIISGNGHGIFLPNASTNHVIEGNWIGVDITGNKALPNTSDGIAINGTPTPSSSGNVIRGNVIAGNRNSGVQISGANAVGNTIEDNLIGVGADGVTALRNGHPSILTTGWGVLTTSSNTTISGNTIRNSGIGVQVGTSASDPVAGVRITENAISQNVEQAIDLGGDGATANDAGDVDGGPNNRQNTPVLTGATTTSASGTLDTSAGTYRIEVFASPAGDCDDAARFVGAADATTDGGGHAAFVVPVTDVVAGEQLTATATSAAGSTSELSACAEAVAATARVRIAKVTTTPSSGEDFTFTGPGGATSTSDGALRGGEVIVYVDHVANRLELLDLATGVVTPVANTTAARDPEWSPDGSRIAFVTGGTLRVLDVATGVVTSLPSATPSGTKFSPTWSPDGQWLAFHHYIPDDIWVIPTDGTGTATQLSGVSTSDDNPSWGPDSRLAFTRSGDVYVGTFNPSTVALEGVHVLPNSTSLANVNRPIDWSPDGTKIVAASTAVNAQDDLYVLKADGTGSPTQLTSGTAWDIAPSWSPDGASIVYTTDLSGDPKIRTIAADGVGGPHATAIGDEPAMDPAWGRSVAFGSDSYTLQDGDEIGGLAQPGSTVTFTELATAGWVLEGIDCGDHPRAVVDGSSVTFTPLAGDDILCTFTNAAAPQTGTIVIKTETLPDGDPTKFAFSGATTASLGDGESVSVTVPAGEHTVTEAMPASYWLPSSIVCDDSDSTGSTTTASATYRVAIGETVTCVFTNRGYGRVRIGKTSDPAGGQDFQFVETVGSNPPGPAAPVDDGQTYGGYGPAGLVRTFEELADPAWQLTSIDCDDHPRAVVSLAERKVTFTPGVGDDILCTFTNVQAPGTIIIEKQTFPDEDPTVFEFSGAVPTSLADDDTATASIAPGAYTVTETVPFWWKSVSISCDDADSTGDIDTATATIHVDPGETVRCTFTNQGFGYVEIHKSTDPADGGPFGFTERIGSTVHSTFELSDGELAGLTVPAGVARSYTESTATGWALDAIDCGDDDAAVTDVANRKVTITAVVGVKTTCTFENTGTPNVHVTLLQRNDAVSGTAPTDDPITGVQPGDRMRYLAIARNTGAGAAQGFSLSIPVPARATLAGSLTSNCALAGGVVTCTGTSLAPGAGRTMQITLDLSFGCDVYGTRFGDVLDGTTAAEKVCGFGGNDDLLGHGGGDVILGDTPVDIDLSDLPAVATAAWTAPGGGGSATSNTVVASLQLGADGIDRLRGGEGNDTLFGQGANDLLMGQEGVDRAYGGDGNDEVRGGDLSVTLAGDGGDEVAGGPGDDRLAGGSGDDWLHGDQGDDAVEGGDGNDIATGDGGNDNVRGDAGNDFVSGDDGADNVIGDAGADRLTGGTGDDRVYGDFPGSAPGGNDHGSVSVRTNHPLQGGGAATFDGGGLFGQDGDDLLFGGVGTDSMYGGPGEDYLSGEDGNDDGWGGSGRDVLHGDGGDDLLLGDDPGSSDTGDGLSDRLFGGAGMDSLYGQNGNNVTTVIIRGLPAGLFGGDGNDYIVGGPLADDAFGGAGNDQVRGGAGVDRIAGDGGNPDTGATPDPNNTGGAADLLSGEEGRDLLYGEGGSEGHCSGAKCVVPKFTAGAERSRPATSWSGGLNGGAGIDVLHGGYGSDRLDGGGEAQNVLVGGEDVDLCSAGPPPGDRRDRSCEEPTKGTLKLVASDWAWASFRP